MTGRLRVLALLPALLAALVTAQAHAAGPQLKSPAQIEVARVGSAPLADSTLTAAGTLRLLRSSFWGGEISASTGETVTVLVSRTYPEDPAVAQRWADFLAGLVHGDELARITAYLAPLSEVMGVCGDDALACYSPRDELLVAPGEDPDARISAEAIVAHEYGHHIARNRVNTPWPAVDWGTKRWTSYVGVCARTRAGELFPGSQSVPRYRSNPGEAFAEAYRVLNERKAGVAETPWEIVSERLYPDDRALRLLEQDVVRPWTATSTRIYRSRVTRTVRTRRFQVPTPLDGRLTATVRAPKGARLELEVLAANRRIARVRTTAGASRRVTATVCGTRTYQLRVRALAGTGTVRLDVEKP